uniref:Helicase ATP-binding domain-containing protein n=1 Tax=viral metagenome TaxID=1070528 RepID=A0A6C0BXX1_9ZZZZ
MTTLPKQYTDVQVIAWYSDTFPNIPGKEKYINFLRQQSIDGELLSSYDNSTELSEGIDSKLHRDNIIKKWKSYVKSFNESTPDPDVTLPVESSDVSLTLPKMFLLVKPCQSGKTGEAFSHLNGLIEEFNTEGKQRHIAITFVDNNLILAGQTSIRSQNILKECESIDFTSKSEIHSADVVRSTILDNPKLGNIICCGHTTRFSDIDWLLPRFPLIKFTIYIDEADKIATSNKVVDYVNSWERNSNVNQIIMITATSEQLLKKYNNITLLPVNEVTHQNYVRFSECQYMDFNPKIVSDENQYSPNTYYVLEYFKNNTMNNGEVYFIPTSTKRKDHDEIEDVLIDGDYVNVVIKINALKKQITILRGQTPTEKKKEIISFKDIEGSTKKELSHWLGDYYEKNEGSTKWRLAITGNICVGRGISIQSEKCSISHAIYGPAISSMPKANKYQIGARILGNIRNFKKFENDTFPIIICQKSTYDQINRMEETAILIANKSTNQNSSYGLSDYKADYSISKHDFEYPEDKSGVRWYDNNNDPNDLKTKTKAKFKKIDNKWCNHDSKLRIWGDRPAGGCNSKNKTHWTLVYENSSYTKYAIVSVKLTKKSGD